MAKTPTKNPKVMKDPQLALAYFSICRKLDEAKEVLKGFIDGTYEGPLLKEGAVASAKYFATEKKFLEKECLRRNEWNIKNGKKAYFEIK